MGANKPLPTNPEPKTSKFTLVLLAGSVLLIIVLIRNLVLEKNENKPKLSPKEKMKLQKRLREIDDSEQYALIAIENGYYPCLHSGRKLYFLKTGEIWKYGVTSKGKFGRYTAAFLIKNKVQYRAEFMGTFSECLKQEQIKLFEYPYLPENLDRPLTDRLPRPPYNSIMR